MNTPMIYWFIPRGVFHFFDYLLLGAFLLWLGWLALGVYDPGLKRRGRSIVLTGLTLALVVWWGYGNYQARQAWEVRQAYFKAAWAHFHKRCESAHVTYFKSVPPQDAVFIMRPAKRATSAQLKDQFWLGDPYDLPDAPGSEANGLLFRKKSMPAGNPWGERGGFDVVEAPHPSLPGQYIRYSMKWSGESTKWGEPIPDHNRIRSSPDTVPTRLARYGYTWDDISTKEDRHFWVAGGRLRMVELETGEVVAERVGYVIERYFGATASTFNPAPWRSARTTRGATCPNSNGLDSNGLRGFISVALGTWNELQPQGSKK